MLKEHAESRHARPKALRVGTLIFRFRQTKSIAAPWEGHRDIYVADEIHVYGEAGGRRTRTQDERGGSNRTQDARGGSDVGAHVSCQIDTRNAAVFGTVAVGVSVVAPGSSALRARVRAACVVVWYGKHGCRFGEIE